MELNAQWKGVKSFVDKFRAADAAKQKQIENGFKKGGLIIFRQSQIFVPVDKGNLKGSGFVRAVGEGINTRVQIGYTASYALYVHEDLSAHHGEAFNKFHAEELAKGHKSGPYRHNRGENQIAKFLENAIIVKRQAYVDAVRDSALKGGA